MAVQLAAGAVEPRNTKGKASNRTQLAAQAAQTLDTRVRGHRIISAFDARAGRARFRGYAESDDNLFDWDAVHGLFAAYSHFVREGCAPPQVWLAIADLVNRLVGGPDADLDNAACACFLENLASRDHPLDHLLRGEALAYWRRWCDGG